MNGDREPTIICACCERDWPHDDVRMVRIGGEERDVCPFCVTACPLCVDAVEEGDSVRFHEETRTTRSHTATVRCLAHAECVEQAERESEDISASDRRETFWGER